MVVNQLPLEDYLVGAVKAEAGDKMPIEMLKAQAIVARTYAAYHRRLNAAKPYHLVAGTAEPAVRGPRATPIRRRGRRCARRTGLVLLLEGKLFPAFYHTDSGGYTEDPRVVFAANNMPALKPVRVEFPSQSPHHAWSLDVASPSCGRSQAGRHLGGEHHRPPRARAERLPSRVPYRGGGHARERDLARQRVQAARRLRHAQEHAVRRLHRPRLARFVGRGYGHGVGLDQWSAKTMAEQGYTAQQIAQYYYPGATLATLNPTSP